ncbi:MAG: hypothetical protein Q9165_007889 [Trypethelium subeluteriae]
MATAEKSRRLLRRLFKGQSLPDKDLPSSQQLSNELSSPVAGMDGKSLTVSHQTLDVDEFIHVANSSLWGEVYSDFTKPSMLPEVQSVAKRLRDESSNPPPLNEMEADPATHVSTELYVCTQVLDTSKKRLSALERGTNESVVRRLWHAYNDIVRWTQKFMTIGDILAQIDPIHIGLPWAGIRAILIVSVHSQNVQVEVLEGIAELSKLICRYEAFESVYLHDESTLQEPLRLRLRAALKELYSAVFMYLVEVNLYLERSLGRKILDTINFSDHFKQQSVDIKQKEAEVLRYEAMSIKDSSYQQYVQVRKILSTYEDHLESEKRAKICDWLSKIDYYSHHREMKSRVLKETGNWFLDRREFKNWIEDSNSSLLWLRGNAGTGKTCLMSCAIEVNLEEQGLDSRECFAYFYCSRTTSDVRQQEPRSILLSIVRQMAAALPGLPIKPPVVSMYEKETARGSLEANLSIEEIVSLLTELIQDHYEHVTLIIDALDECKISDRALLLETLSEVTYNHKTVVKTLVSSRNDPDIETHFSKIPNLSITATDNEGDIMRYVHQNIDQRLLNGKATRKVKDKVADNLVRKASGVFRWVTLQMDALCDPERVFTEADVEELLLSLPANLEESYARIITDLDRLYPLPTRNTIKNALKLLICAEYPMDVDDMVGALQLLSDHRQVDLNKAKILRMGRGMIIMEVERGCFAFAHLSVREFLEKHDDFNEKQAHVAAAEACLKAYLDPSFRHSFLWYALTHLGRHCLKSQELRQTNPRLKNLMEKFLLDTESNTAFQRWNQDCFQTDVETAPGTCDERRRSQSQPAQPLFMTCVYGFDDFAEKMLAGSSSALYAESFYGDRPLEVAAHYGHYRTMVLLYNTALSSQKSSVRPAKWLTAAAQSSVLEIWKFALDHVPLVLISEVLPAAARNPQYSKEMVASLLRDARSFDEETLSRFLISCASFETLDVVIPYVASFQFTDSLILAAVQNPFLNPELTEMIISKCKAPQISSACIIGAVLLTYEDTTSKEAVVKLLLEQPERCEISEEMIHLIASMGRTRAVECLEMLLPYCRLDRITEDILAAAAKNIYAGPTILELLLSQALECDLSQQVLQSAMLNRWRATGSFNSLTARSECPLLQEESLYILTETWSGEKDSFATVMARCESVYVTEAYLEACAGNREASEVKQVLALPRAFPITKDVVCASLTNFSAASDVLMLLLQVKEGFKLPASENILLQALSSEVSDDLRLARILADEWGYLPVTEKVLMAAVKHGRNGTRTVKLLLERSKESHDVFTQNVLHAAVEGDNVEFVEYFKQQQRHFTVDEKLLKEAIRPYSTNNAILRILLSQKDRCLVSKPLLDTAMRIREQNPSAFELLLEHSDITESETTESASQVGVSALGEASVVETAEEISFQALVTATSKDSEPSQYSTELGTSKLEQMLSKYRGPAVDSGKLVEVAAERRDGKFVVQYIISLFPETSISRRALLTAASNQEAPTSLLGLLLKNYSGSVDSQLLKAAAENMYRGTQMFERLLARYPNEIKIDQDVVAAGLKNAYCGQSLFELFLRRDPQLNVTAELVDAASENEVLGKILLQRLLERALILRSNESAELALRKIENGANGLRDALFMAACYGQDLIMEFLTLHRTSLTTVSGELGTVLNVAVYAGQENIVKMLLEKGSDPESNSKLYGTALETACQQSKIEIIRLLVHNGASIDRPGEMGRTVLHMMARQGEDEVVNILTSLGASITRVDRQGLAALHHAALCSESSDCIDQLIQSGAVINQQDSYQWTALHWAARAGDADTVAQLLQAGANKTKTDISGRIPLYVVIYSGNVYLRPKLYFEGAPDLPIKPAENDNLGRMCDACSLVILRETHLPEPFLNSLFAGSPWIKACMS